MEDIKRTIDALTSLIEVNNKRMRLYHALAEKMHHNELRSLFKRYAEQSKQFSSTLSTWRAAYGGFAMPEKKGASSVLEQVKSLFEHWLRKNVASKCEEVELDALKVYKTVIQMPFLPSVTASDIEEQSVELGKALEKLRILRNQPGSDESVREELAHTLAL